MAAYVVPLCAAADGRIEAIALQGDGAVDGNGQQYWFHASPVVSDSGSVAYVVEHAFSLDQVDEYAVNLRNASGLHQLVRGNEPAPDGNGSLWRFFRPAINAVDDVAIHTRFAGSVGGLNDDRGVVMANTTGAGIVVREGDVEPSGVGTVHTVNDQDESSPLPLDAAGRVVVPTNLAGVPGVFHNIVRGDGSALPTELVRQGDAIPGGGASYGSFFLEGANDAGAVVYRSILEGAANGTEGTVTLDTGLTRTVVAREGVAAPDGNGVFNSFSAAAIGNNGHVAVVASYRDTLNGAADNFAVTRHDDVGNMVVFREGDAAPSGNGSFRGGASNIGDPLVNSWGQVALRVEYSGTADGSNDNTGLVRYKQAVGHLPQLVELVREGDAAPDGNGEFQTFTDVQAMNEAGVVLFEARLRNASVGNNSVGVYLSDGFETIRVAKTVQEFGLSPDSLNRHGQVAYRAGGNVAGATGVYLFTPDLYWRALGSGSWDNIGNASDWQNYTTANDLNPNAFVEWTLGLEPGPMHNVFIDPDRFYGTVGLGSQVAIWDTVDATVRSLTLRDRARIAYIGGQVTALDGTWLDDGSTISGYGELNGDVHIAVGATIESDALNFGGDIDNDGTLVFKPIPGSLAYLSEVQGDVVNNGETIVSSGVIVPNVPNPPMASRFHGDFTNHGTLRIGASLPGESAADRADIFGDYYGPGVIENNGVLVFHGGFFPGASPVRHEYLGTGSFELGAGAHTVMEIAGLVPGTEHADPAAEYDSIHLVDGGTLVLGGSLEIDLIAAPGGGDDFMPAIGDLFVLFTAGAIIGDFDQPLMLPELGEGLVWQVIRDQQSLAVAVAAVPLPGGIWLLLPALAWLHRSRTRESDGRI